MIEWVIIFILQTILLASCIVAIIAETRCQSRINSKEETTSTVAISSISIVLNIVYIIFFGYSAGAHYDSSVLRSTTNANKGPIGQLLFIIFWYLTLILTLIASILGSNISNKECIYQNEDERIDGISSGFTGALFMITIIVFVRSLGHYGQISSY